MSRTLNKVMLIGNVGKDPELKYTPSGIPVTSFRMATTETWKDHDGKSLEHTDWHNVVAWRGLAEVIQRLVTKGSKVYIEGRIQTRTFEDRSGTQRHVVEILAENMLLLDGKKPRTESNGLINEDSVKPYHDEYSSLSMHFDDFDTSISESGDSSSY